MNGNSPTTRTANPVEVASAARNILGESPVWSVEEGALYWTDIREPALYRLHAESGRTQKWPMPELAGAVVLHRNGGVVVGLQTGLYAFDPAIGALERIVSFDNAHPDDRTNDSRCDRQGRLWFSRMRDFGRAATGAIYRMDASLRPVRVLSGLRIPNAICFSPEGDCLYFADTPDGVLEAVDLARESGRVMKRRLLVGADGIRGMPDGATVDAEGCIWNARFGGGCVIRLTPDGEVDAVIELPVSRPTSCAFGGKKLDRLYITTATQGLDLASQANEPLAGSLLAIDVGIAGLEEPSFSY